jgi:hypothetical protein
LQSLFEPSEPGLPAGAFGSIGVEHASDVVRVSVSGFGFGDALMGLSPLSENESTIHPMRCRKLDPRARLQRSGLSERAAQGAHDASAERRLSADEGAGRLVGFDGELPDGQR